MLTFEIERVDQVVAESAYLAKDKTAVQRAKRTMKKSSDRRYAAPWITRHREHDESNPVGEGTT